MIDRNMTEGKVDEDIAEGIETVTQETFEDQPELIDKKHSPPATEKELSQENLIINPDPDSMESRG